MGLRAQTAATSNGNAQQFAAKGKCLGSAKLKTQQKVPEIVTTTLKVNEAAPKRSVTTTKTTMTTTTTYRSSSTSALVASYLRPQTLNVQNAREMLADQTQLFFGEILSAWRAKARCNVVPAERTLELFHELSFHPSDKQISEMLQTAKVLACKGGGNRQSNGLTFGEFCVLAADLKRFRASTFSSTATTLADKVSLLSSLQTDNDGISNAISNENTHTECKPEGQNSGTELRGSKSLGHVEDCKRKLSKTGGDEVFLGGSCNPTTWRADVAIPALKESGISFYNPQVSHWTPDLIELEHRAKEKARVLFFVMDAETRASAAAIEASHIAGQNCKQLVLVLHPYKPNQYILNEHISHQEYTDLRRNQLILKELVSRRGLPVLDNIPAGLERTKEILAGIRDPPSNIASILVVVRGAFDRVSPVNNSISGEQCQRALQYLGYAQSLIKLDSLNKIIASQRETLCAMQKSNSTNAMQHNNKCNSSTSSEAAPAPAPSCDIDFELFCIISAYLSVLQQEIHESGCISPIKGTNVPPPPVYLTNMQSDDSFAAINYFTSKNISRTSSNASVPSSDDRQSINDVLGRSRDSGTSSPQPLEPLKSRSGAHLCGKQKTQIFVNVESTLQTTKVTAAGEAIAASTTSQTTPLTADTNAITTEEESDSNDSVFSSSSSINSVNCNFNSGDSLGSFSSHDFRDVYLGGSCLLRTKWRQNVAMPYLKAKSITFHLPALHESIQSPQHNDAAEETAMHAAFGAASKEERTFIRTRRKSRTGVQVEPDEDSSLTQTDDITSSSSLNWALPPVRSNLYNPALLDSSRVLLFVITNETRSLAPMTLAAHCIGLMYNVVLAVQMLPDDCVISNEKLTPAAINDYNRGRSYLIDLAKRQGVPVFSDLKAALECTVDKVKACNSRNRCD